MCPVELFGRDADSDNTGFWPRLEGGCKHGFRMAD